MPKSLLTNFQVSPSDGNRSELTFVMAMTKLATLADVQGDAAKPQPSSPSLTTAITNLSSNNAICRRWVHEPSDFFKPTSMFALDANVDSSSFPCFVHRPFAAH